MANELLNGPRSPENPKKAARKKTAKKAPKAHKVIFDVQKVETPKNGLLTSGLPTWAYKKGEESVILRTKEDVEKYVEDGWTDIAADAK